MRNKTNRAKMGFFPTNNCLRWHSKPRFSPALFLFCAFISIILIHQASGFPLSSSYVSRNVPIQLELVDTGPVVVPCDAFDTYKSSTNCASNDLYHLQVSGYDAAPLFPFFNGDITIELYRDPGLNLQQHNRTDYNIFVTDQYGIDRRVDGIDLLHDGYQLPPHSKISFFRGQILLANNSTSSFSPSRYSQVMAIGYIDDQYGIISLQAFIRHRNVLLYLRPNSANNRSINSNMHFISNESNTLGNNIFKLFEKQFVQQNTSSKRVHKRSTNVVNQSCPMMIKADYTLFNLMNRSRAKTVLFIHFVYTIANNIFLNTNFTRNGFIGEVEDVTNSDIFSGYGHTLCKIVIEEHPPSKNDDLYNEDRTYWPQEHMETVLKRLKDRAGYCLAFIFTNMKIEGTKYSDVNGISMDGGIFSESEEVANGGAVSFGDCQDPWSLECVLNFAHELGHSWGAIHDSDIDECFPTHNGTYLMSFPFLYQIGQHNFFFSPCSIRAIYVKIEGLLHKNSHIFSSFCSKCGNGRIEDSEECDEGDDSYGQCCTKSCTLKQNSTCSPYNHDCCDDHCQIVSTKQVCRGKDPAYCFAESRCDGTSAFCPAPNILPDGALCGPSNSGFCTAGTCNSTCPPKHTFCECEDHSCSTCCQAVTPLFTDGEEKTELGKCLPMLNKSDGTPCVFNETLPGRCMAGWCQVIKTPPVIPADIVPDDDGDVVIDGKPKEETEFFTVQNIIVLVLLLLVLLFVGIWCLRVYWNRSHSGRVDFSDGHQRTDSDARVLMPRGEDDDEDERVRECFPCLSGKAIPKEVATNGHNNA